MMQDNRGYTIDTVRPIVLMLVVIAMLFGAGLYVTANLNDKILALTDGNRSNSTSLNQANLAIDNATEGLADLATWIPIIVVIIAAAIIIGIVIRSFGTGQKVE